MTSQTIVPREILRGFTHEADNALAAGSSA